MVKKLDDSMAALSMARRERVEARVQELAGQVRVGLANKEDVVGGRGAAHLLPAALRNVEDVMPIRSDLEFQQVQAEILAASDCSNVSRLISSASDWIPSACRHSTNSRLRRKS